MPSRRLELTFPNELIQEPVIYQLGHRFEVVTNIRRANVTDQHGWVVLELGGAADELERAIEYLEDLGIKVSPVTRDVIE